MDVKTGEQALRELFHNYHVESFRKRFCFSDLMDYLHRDYDPRVCTIYGLRRTGKTTLMAQAAAELRNPDSVCWIICGPDDEIQDVKNVIRNHPQCRYFFLDEATRLENFMDASSILADRYTAIENKRIVMAGTDSLGFHFAFGSELFDRTHIFHTTYIPYREYRYLLGDDKTIDAYIEYGGTLTDGKIFYHSDKTSGMDYANDAIAENIFHSLEHYRGGGAFGALLPIYASGELTTFIRKIVELDNRTFLAQTVNRMFRSHDMGVLRSNLTRDSSLDVDASVLKNKDFLEDVRKALSIREPLVHKADAQAIETVKDYLEALDVIYVVPGTEGQTVIFSQPGLRYSQVEKEKKLLLESKYLKGFQETMRRDFARRLDETIKGRIMENIVFLDLTKNEEVSARYQVTTYCNTLGTHEFDVVLFDKEKDDAIILEVKHSDDFAPVYQARHLYDEDACAEFEQKTGMKIVGKGVVYRGDTRYYAAGIQYVSVDAMLEKPLLCIQMLQNSWDSHVKKTIHRPKEH